MRPEGLRGAVERAVRESRPLHDLRYFVFLPSTIELVRERIGHRVYKCNP
ncbi:MAG: hypothetical protein M1305_06985 [Candidatus Marsarchaeota archaeon]|nr:hypothetical protein [Candidatus Marsarchaeota archaeon]